MSNYEKNYIRWYFNAHKKKFLYVLVLLFVSLPLFSLLTPEKVDPQYYHVPFVLETCIYGGIMAIFVFVIPICNFRFLMGKRSCDTFFAMPIKRKRFFAIQYCLGIISILTLVNCAFLLALLCDPATWSLWMEYLSLMFIISLSALCLYTLYTFLIMKCNNLWDAIMVCLGYTVMPIFMYAALNSLINEALSSFLISFTANVDEVLSYSVWSYLCSVPAYVVSMIANFFETAQSMHHEPLYFYDEFFKIANVIPICFWILVSGILYVRARYSFATRHGEASEQRTSTWLCYPVLIALITVSLLMNGGISINIIFSGMNILFVFILYLIMVFFAKRRIALTKGVLLVFVSLVASVVFITFVFTSTRGFHRIQEMPSIEDVTIVQVHFFSELEEIQIQGREYMSLNSYHVKEKDRIKEIYELHNTITNHLVKMDSLYEERMTIDLYYELKNGKTLQREYRIPKQQEAVLNEIKQNMKNLIDKGYFDEDIQQQQDAVQ